MGWLKMSKQELRRVEVLTEVLGGRRTTESAAGVLGVSLRQAQRLAARYRDGGGGALIHKSRGRPEGTLRYREVTEDVEGNSFKHRIAEIHATSMKRLSKVETPDDPTDGAGDE